MTDTDTEMAFIATNDLVGITRGRGMPLAGLREDMNTGCGWVPANLAIGVFGKLVDNDVFSAVDDLRLIPDPTTITKVTGVPGKPPITLALADITHTDGSPWRCCPRTFLRDAIEDLRKEAGLKLYCAFEHEFMTLTDKPAEPPFSLQSARGFEPFGSDLLKIMTDAGLEPENWLPEYGDHQWEITVAPSDPLAAADRAVLLREVVRDLARAQGDQASFAPLVHPDGSGNGVHLHMSLQDLDGNPVTYDAARPGRLSKAAGSFAAGILRHAPALVALTAPSMISYLRLVPHRWSAGYAFLGERNREALLRICPTVEIDGKDPAPQLNIEYRACDATANPWIALGVLIRAGLQGIREDLATPVVVDADIDTLSQQEKDAAGVALLPDNLADALKSFLDDPVASSWFPEDMKSVYLAIKRDEIKTLQSQDTAVQCQRYADVY